jgi:hypothetical protein
MEVKQTQIKSGIYFGIDEQRSNLLSLTKSQEHFNISLENHLTREQSKEIASWMQQHQAEQTTNNY